ncbi:MAG: response regulator [Elusimicrobia bacterium]|nr:response regulator [Elusimicrobiota bacterium]
MPTTIELAFSVLVVDDEPDARSILKGELEKLSGVTLKVSTAGDGDEALNKLKETPYDLVFLDYRLPPTDGLDILEKIRQHHPKTAVVMTTAAGSEQVAVAAMKKGAMDYITQKDLRQTDLNQLLRRVIEIRDLVNQNMELRQVNQMKNEFIANVSHELRTPLTVVIGYANTMRDGSLGTLTDAQQKALGSIIDRAEGLMATLNNILSIREVHEGRKQLLLKPVELGKLVAAQVEKAGREIRRRKLKLETAYPKSEIWVMAVEDELGEVIDNLLSNACKFSPAEGALTVKVSVEKGRARLAVTDAGPGIPPEVLPHIFDTFSAANQGPTREYPGLGLGLPLSKQLIEAIGGRIWVESEGSGRGTTARLEVPVSTKDAAPVVVDGSQNVRKKRILIVEDNPDLIEVLMLFLASVSRNLSIVTAHSGFEALERIEEDLPSLVILDVMMPGMDGFEVLSRLKRLPKEKRPPVMVLTGYSDALARAKEAGADDVMLKPFEKNAFVKKVLHLLGTNIA